MSSEFGGAEYDGDADGYNHADDGGGVLTLDRC
jgi:hypothetical protein